MLFTLRSIQYKERSVFRDQLCVLGVRSLLIVEKVLMNNNLAIQQAISRQRRFFFIRHSQAVDSWDKCLNEYGRHLKK